MDQDVINLAKAIRQKESGGDFNAIGDAGTSKGGYQWQPATWKANAKMVLGDENAQMTPDNQNAVAYAVIKKDKDAGLNPAQIAAKWNSGKTQGWENMVGTTTINGQKVKYNVPQYVKDVTDHYQKLKGTSYQSPAAPVPTVNQSADQASADRSGAFVPANTENGGAITEGLKVIPNLIPSAFNFAKGALDTINPLSTVDKLKQSVTAFGDIKKANAETRAANELGAENNNKLIQSYQQKKLAGQDVSHLESYFKSVGIDPNQGNVSPAKSPTAFGQIAKSVPMAVAETIVPEAGRDLASAAFAGATGNERFGSVDENLKAAQRNITNDPVGSILPFLVAAKGGAKGVDNMRSKAAMSDYVKNIDQNYTKPIPRPSTTFNDAFETGMKKTSELVTKPAGFVAGKVTSGVRGAFSQAVGLNPETTKQVIKNPSAFTKESMATTDRASIGRQVQSELAKLAEEKATTGKEYQPIRDTKIPIRVEADFWDNTFKETTGLDIKKGKLEPSTTSSIRDAGDVRALQKVYEFWKPKFKEGAVTPAEYLNMREDLAKASKFEKDIGKRKDVEVAAGRIRAKLNEAYRPQIGGLKELDATMSEQIRQYKELTHGLVDSNGVVTDAGLKKIANLSKDKPNLAKQLETILPGITEKVKTLQAVVDIERASGIKVGTYTKSGIVGAGLLMGGPLQAVINMILTSPELAVPILRKYGLIKNSAAVQAVVHALKKGGSALNNLPSKAPSTTVFGGQRELIGK